MPKRATLFTACVVLVAAVSASPTPGDLSFQDDPTAIKPVLFNEGSRAIRSVNFGEDGFWENTMRDVIGAGVKQIPYAGDVIRSILLAFWPENKPNIWLQIKDRVENLIDHKLQDFEEFLHLSDLDALKLRMQEYRNNNIQEKGVTLNGILGKCMDVFARLDRSPNRNQTFVLAINLAYVHMAALREMYLFGEQMYPNQPSGKVQWLKDMQIWVARYWKFVESSFTQWQSWRMEKLELEEWVTTHGMALPPFFQYHCHMKLTDKLIDIIISEMEEVLCSVKKRFNRQAMLIRQAYYAREEFAMISVVSKMFVLHQYIPGYESLGPYSGQYPELTLGPIQPTTYRVSPPHYPITSDLDRHLHFCSPEMGNVERRNVTKVVVRSWNWVDGMQVFYENGADSFVGKSDGGEAKSMTFEPKTAKCLSSIKWKFSQGWENLISVTLTAGDGSTSPEMGNIQGMADIKLTMSSPAMYCITQIALCDGANPQSITGVQVFHGLPNGTIVAPQPLTDGLNMLAERPSGNSLKSRVYLVDTS